MTIPTRNQCLMLMNQTQMPPHIQRHSFVVAEIAVYVGRLLNQDSAVLDLDLVEAGALVHDIAKARSIVTGERHEVLGAQMIQELGFPVLASIVKDHVHIEAVQLDEPVSESLLVNYADKRVKHHQVVTLEDRFHDLMDRYAKTPTHRTHLRDKLDLFLEVEKKIFRGLPIDPNKLMHFSLQSHQ